jgi:hypothetical protein
MVVICLPFHRSWRLKKCSQHSTQRRKWKQKAWEQSNQPPSRGISNISFQFTIFHRKIQLKKRDTIKLCLLGCQLYQEILEVYAGNMIQRNQIEDLKIMKVAKEHIRMIHLKEIEEEGK